MPIALLDDDTTLTFRDSELGLEDGDDATSYTIRVVSPQIVKKLRKQHTKRKPTGGAGMADSLDVDAYAEALFDYVLVSWVGPMWKGQPIGADDYVTTGGVSVKAKTQLDGSRKAALLERAGGNQIVAEGRDDSFRAAP